MTRTAWHPAPREYHVYAEDGFESAHRSERAAKAAAKRGAKLRRLEYRVIRTDAYGLTGPSHGEEVARFTSRGAEVRSC